MIASLIVICLSQAQPLPPIADTPGGFKRVFKNDVRLAKDGPGFYVSISKGLLMVEDELAHNSRVRRIAAAAQKGKKEVFKVKMEAATITWFGESDLEVADGWLQPVDAGEFGGGIIWFAKDHSGYKVISDLNTQLLTKTSRGIFAFQGLNHLGFWYSKLVEVEHGSNGWKTRLVTDLHEVTRAIFQDGDRFLMGMDEYITAIETDGTHRELFHFDGPMHPTSIVKTKSGIVWVGLQSSLLRLEQLKNGTYRDDWFVRAPTS